MSKVKLKTCSLSSFQRDYIDMPRCSVYKLEFAMIGIYCCVIFNTPLFINNYRFHKYSQSIEMCYIYNITVNIYKTIQELFYSSNVMCHAGSFHGLPSWHCLQRGEHHCCSIPALYVKLKLFNTKHVSYSSYIFI